LLETEVPLTRDLGKEFKILLQNHEKNKTLGRVIKLEGDIKMHPNEYVDWI
jgi:hypothetical protein